MSDIPHFTIELAVWAIEQINSFGIMPLFILAINAPSKLAVPAELEAYTIPF